MGLDCFDTMTLIKLVQALESPDHPDSGEFLAYLKEVEEEKHIPVLPTPVIAEYLVGIPEDKWAAALDIFRERFRIYELNQQASIEAARLMHVKLHRDNKLGSGQERQCVRTDAFILGIAITNGCDRLFSTDGWFRGVVEGRIKIEVAPQAEQPPLL